MISNKAFSLRQGHRAYGTPILYYYYIFSYYPPHSVKSFGDAISRELSSNHCNLLQEMPRYCGQVQILYFAFLVVLEILTKCKAACSDRQTKESAVKCLSQRQNNVSSFRTATVSIAFAINQNAFTQSVILLTFYNEHEIKTGVGTIFQTRAVFNTLIKFASRKN